MPMQRHRAGRAELCRYNARWLLEEQFYIPFPFKPPTTTKSVRFVSFSTILGSTRSSTSSIDRFFSYIEPTMSTEDDEETFDERLIDEVRNHPQLYDPKHIHYHNNVMKDETWIEIAASLDFDVLDCKKKWTSLRDNFRKAVKKRHNKNLSMENPEKPCKFQEKFAFLIPFLLNKRPRMENKKTPSEKKMVEGRGGKSTSSKSFGTRFTVAHRNNMSTVTGGKSEQLMRSPQGLEDPSVSKNYFEKTIIERTPRKDHLHKFFEAVEETVRTFDPQFQIEIKGKISGLVTEYELKNLHHQLGTHLSDQSSPNGSQRHDDSHVIFSNDNDDDCLETNLDLSNNESL